jgi:tetratricopeptide (TPR) repeat protein
MAMFQVSKIPFAALLLLSASLASAQEPEPAAEEEVPAPPPADFVQKGQIVAVSDEDIDEGSDDYLVPELTDADLLEAEFQLFKDLMNENVFDEADTVAKRVVELAIRTHGPQSNQFAKALTNLAIVQFQTEQYDASVQNFESAIEIIEDNEDRLNAQLINPLKGLGAAQLESGRPDLASQTFQRAVHVTHVNEGPHNLDQLELLESVAETYVRMGDIDAAKDVQDTIYAINIREHQLDSPSLVPSLMRRAAWQHRAGFIFDERATYRRAIRIIEQHEGKDSISLVEPLIMLGRSFFYLDTTGAVSFHDNSMASGEIYFRRATSIATESPDSNWQVVAQAGLALADYYIYNANPNRAHNAYAETWDLLSQSEERLTVRREQLEQVIPLKQNNLPMYASSDSEKDGNDRTDPLLQGNITISYAVSARGRAAEMELVEAQPPEFVRMKNTVQREIQSRIFRPRLEEGQVVDTPNQLLVHRFFYRQTDLDALRAEQAAK